MEEQNGRRGKEPHKKRSVRDLSADELAESLKALGEKPYRASQIYGWIHVKGASDWDEMSNIPRSLREKMADLYSAALPEIRACQISAIDGTRKYLFAMEDGNCVESVRMSYHHGISVCISSQVGCRMGCTFCASTLLGLTRNLTAGEMLGQIYAIAGDTGERVSNVVVMGTGEPLDNYDELVKFIRMLTDSRGLNISERNVTVSTCGLVPEIRKLAGEKLMINLALSLHAPDDALRQKLMPVAKAFSLKEILDALRYYYAVNHRRLTFEYSLVRDLNDSDGCADALARLLSGLNCLVNLIPVNPVTETGYRDPAPARVAAFKKKLENHGIHVTIRREMGRDIDGACGQLRMREKKQETDGT